VNFRNTAVFDPTSGLDLDELRARLRAMDDAALERYGKAAAKMASPQSRWGGAPRDCFAVQLEEARAEWQRRHPKDDQSVSF
jgi:hypothetical protein